MQPDTAGPSQAASPEPGLLGMLIRLRLQLFANAFRRSPWHVVGLAVAVLYGLGAALFVVFGLTALRAAPAEVAHPVVIVFGSLLTLGFLLVPLAFGVDDAMDPRRFALFGIPSGRLSAGLAVAALLSVPSLVVLLVAVAQVITWSRGPAMVLALLAAVLIVATCVLGARVTTSLAAFALSSRRARETVGTLGVLVVLLAAPALALLANTDWAARGLETMRELAHVLAWTPLGAAWAAPAAAASGDGGQAVGALVVAAATAAALWFGWRVLVERMLVSRHREHDPKTYLGLGWFRLLPATPTGAIAARSLTYWARDARYRISLAVVPIVPIGMFVPLLVVGVPTDWLWLLPVPMMALFLGWSVLHNDVAMDHTAVWQHVASSTRGRSDRWGRAIPILLIGVPLVVVGSLVCAQLSTMPGALPALLGVSSCILLAGVGLSSVMSAAFPYPVVRPGDSPFQQPQTASASGLIQSLSFLAVLTLSAPPLLLAVHWFLTGEGAQTVLLAGVLMGLAVLVGGVALGARIFDRRAPELLAFAARN